jgi:lipopolysaccharide transport system permease protein
MKNLFVAVGGMREITVIGPPGGWRLLDVVELWRYRDLLLLLVWRDISVRYKQTLLGGAWAVIQPLFTMVIFTVFFGRLAGLDQQIAGGIPYSVYTYSALLAWQLFANALNGSSRSLVAQRNIITKVYFPRLLVPLAPILAGLVDFAVASAFLVVLMAWYGIWPGWQLLAFPCFVLLAIVASLAVGIWLSAVNAIYRDVEYTLPFLTQVWLFLTPIAYPASLVPPAWRPVYGLNPMVGVVEGIRWSLFGTEAPGGMLLVSAATVTALLVGGIWYFRRMERVFLDVV